MPQMCFAPLELGLLEDGTVWGPQKHTMKKRHCYFFEKAYICATLKPTNAKLMQQLILTQLTSTSIQTLTESAFSAQERAEVSHRSGTWPPAMWTQPAVDQVRHCTSCKGTAAHALKITPTQLTKKLISEP